jgi:hypothetical protein
MWSFGRRLETSLAAAFWMLCNGLIVDLRLKTDYLYSSQDDIEWRLKRVVS